MWTMLIRAAFSKVGIIIVVGLIGLAGGGFFVWKHSVESKAKKEVLGELQRKEIKKLNNATSAKIRLRRKLTRHPNSLHDDDGYRRAD